MGFWVFMLICVLLLPVSMIITGLVYRKGNYPQKINGTLGYRTNRSMKNKEAWDFAQKRFGKVSFLTGAALLLPSVVPMMFVTDRDVSFTGWFGGGIVMAQVFFMFVPMVFVENSLKKRFNEVNKGIDPKNNNGGN